MTDCPDCQARRNAIIEDVLRFRLLSAAGHAIVGAAEMAGVKDKPSEKKAKAEQVKTTNRRETK